MKIKIIEITNFRSIKEKVTILDIWDCLILTGQNNSWKSSILNALATFFQDRTISKNDFHKWTSEIVITLTLEDLEDDHLLKICDFKRNVSETSALKSSVEIFWDYSNSKIEKESDLNEAQRAYIKNSWLSKFKEDYISDGCLSVSCLIWTDLKLVYTPAKLEKLFPRFILIDDERNFWSEQSWKTWSITEKLFKNIELKSEDSFDEELITEASEQIQNGTKALKDLDVWILERLLQSKVRDKSEEICRAVTENFCSYYGDGFRINVQPNLDVSHKTFSLDTKIYDPVIDDEVWLWNVWAGLRSLYLLALLKAYVALSNHDCVIFAIEEPEIYLHPWLQKKMAEVLSIISKDHQVIFTSHSPILLKPFSIRDIREVKRDLIGKTDIFATDFDNIISNLGYSAFDILKTNYLIFVEWKSDIDIISKIIKKFYPDKIDEVKIISSNSCSNLWYYASFKFLWLTSYNEKNIIVLRDRDNKAEDDIRSEFRNQLSNYDIPSGLIDLLVWTKLIILDRYSIENFFLDLRILSSIQTTFTIDGLLSAFWESEDTLRLKDSIKKSLSVDDFSAMLEKLRSDFDSEKLKIRGHNILRAVIYEINSRNRDSIFKNRIEAERNFFDKYFENTSKSDFWMITETLDFYFWISS